MAEVLERWVGFAACVVGAGLALSSGIDAVGVVVATLVLLVGVTSSPLFPFLHTPLQEAREQATPEGVLVFWKPGCSVCWRLLTSLDSESRRAAMWVNVWRDHDAAELVREHQDGDLLTPTAIRADGDLLRGDDDQRHVTPAVVRRATRQS